MNPILLKILIIGVLSMIFLIFIIFGFLTWKNYVRPFLIRIFLYKKVLKTAQVILKAKDHESKVKGLVKEKLVDLDLIRIAEVEIEKSRLEALKPKKMKKDWRFWKNGKKNAVSEQVAGTENKGVTGSKVEAGGRREAESSTAGIGGKSETGNGETASDNVAPGLGPVQHELARVVRRENKYFH